MGQPRARIGTVGYSYRDWAGIFYPPGTPPRRQFNIYAQNFDVCELTQFTHQMPDVERMTHFAAQIKTDLRLFVRIHNTFTHCGDIGLALTVAKHFRKAIEPLATEGKLAGLVAPFPYAFKNTPENREYIQALASALSFSDDNPMQLDFRHNSWFTEEALEWVTANGLGFVCVDEPSLPGLVPPAVVATANRVLVRLHGRNAEAWWSGNPATRYDYSYSVAELADLRKRYDRLLGRSTEVSFLFQNNWQAQSVANAHQWRQLVAENDPARALAPVADAAGDEESLAPPLSLPLAEVKSRVSRVFLSLQGSLNLPNRGE